MFRALVTSGIRSPKHVKIQELHLIKSADVLLTKALIILWIYVCEEVCTL